MKLWGLLAVVAACLTWLAAPAGARAATWCGTDESSIDRPDLVGGQQTRVLYVLPSDGGDRFLDIAPKIAYDVAAIDSWWRGNDPTRAPRFDLFPFPNCPPGIDQLDIGFVRLTQPGSVFFPEATRMNNLADALAAAGVTTGTQESFKKTLVYYDAPVEFANACGGSYVQPTSGGKYGIVGVWLQAEPGLPGCGTVGTGDYLSRTVVYDFIEQLGGVSTQAPHSCPNAPSLVCDNGQDVMYGGPAGFSSLSTYLLDVGRDDYYGHSGAWPDIQDSPWLAHLDTPDFPLSVTLAGAKSGDGVTSDQPGIVCGTLCKTTFETGTELELSAAAGNGERFVRWTGDCKGTEDTCDLTMNGAHTVQAVFGPATYRMTVKITGRGRVSSGFVCSKTCTKALAAGQTYVFKAAPARGWRFAGWTGACRGRTKCRVALTANKRLGATFTRVPKRR